MLAPSDVFRLSRVSRSWRKALASAVTVGRWSSELIRAGAPVLEAFLSTVEYARLAAWCVVAVSQGCASALTSRTVLPPAYRSGRLLPPHPLLCHLPAHDGKAEAVSVGPTPPPHHLLMSIIGSLPSLAQFLKEGKAEYAIIVTNPAAAVLPFCFAPDAGRARMEWKRLVDAKGLFVVSLKAVENLKSFLRERRELVKRLHRVRPRAILAVSETDGLMSPGWQGASRLGESE